MEKRNYHSDYEMSLSTLEDIQLLSEFSMSPLIGRAYFHLSEIKRKADASSLGHVAHYDQVAKVLDEKFESIFTDFFSNKSKFKNFDYYKSTAKIDLKKWNLILEIIPEVLSIVSMFNYHGTIETRLDESRLLVSGMILEDGHLQMNRKFIYVVTRKLLKQKVLITFNLEKTARTGLFKLDLKVDISHDDSLVYKVNFKTNPKENYLVGFSNIFCHYRALLEDVKTVGEHNIIEISSDLSVKHSLGVPDLSRLESANKEILHFPFLFRPVSIILPMKGNLSTDSFTRSLSSSHDDEQKREQNVSTYYRTIDFFSLFNI
ncbi:MAG: hypothetical protein H7281_15855 [Bacteriovorax sp.]|nr:hypothetical protein [Bacteriovorax sp.]